MHEYTLIQKESQLCREDFLELLIRRMDHDFDNVFFRAMSSVGMVEHFFDDKKMEASYLASIRTNIDHADYITTTLKMLGLGRNSPNEFDLGELLGKVKAYTEMKWLAGKDVNLKLESDEGITVNNIESSIYVQVWNFISNAYTASYDGQSPHAIEVSGKIIHPTNEEVNNLGINSSRYSPEDEFVKVSVRDYGTGIEPEKLEKIFDKGYTSKQSGSGIGLALAGTTATLLHGFVKVESEVGEGSTFSLYLPKELKTTN